MKISSMIGSVLLTIVVGGYFVFTEWSGWKQWDIYKRLTGQKQEQQRVVKKRSNSKREDGKREDGKREDGKAESPQVTESVAKPASAPPPPAEPQVPPRVGTKVYRVDLPCECPEGPAFALESVEVNSSNTILTIANASYAPVAIQPPGHENAQFLLEWRYVNSSRPRHDIQGAEGIATHPSTSTPGSFKLIFPRIADAAQKIQLSGKNSRDLGYFLFTSIKLDDEIPVEEWRRFEALKQCGFDRPLDLGAKQQATVVAHNHEGARGHAWTASGGLSIVKGKGDRNVVIRGDRPGKGELCLRSERGGESCESCQEIDIKPEPPAPEPDFVMKTCGGIPSRPPHWQFSVNSPAKGASYQWSISHEGKVLRGSDTKTTALIRPAPRAGLFTVTLKARYPSGKEASTTREYHGVYSCPQ